MKVILVSEDVLYSKRLSVLLNRTSLLPCKIQNSSEVSNLSTTIKDCNLILLDFKFLKNENLDIKNFTTPTEILNIWIKRKYCF